MKKSKFFLIIFATILVSTFTTYQITKNATGLKEKSSSSDGIRYHDLFIQDAQPDWHDIKTGDFSLSVPYSPSWKITDVGLSVYDVDTPIEKDHPAIRFGKAIDGGTYIVREYLLERSIKKNFDTLQRELTNGCSAQIPAKPLTIDEIQGIQHYSGGAKGCSIGFAFNKGSYTYYLYRISNFGEPTPEINDEMKEIIKSIH